MLVNTASEGESDESVVSAESEKSEKWGEKRGLVVVSCLTGIGFPPQLRALHENFKKIIRNFYEEFYIEFMTRIYYTPRKIHKPINILLYRFL